MQHAWQYASELPTDHPAKKRKIRGEWAQEEFKDVVAEKEKDTKRLKVKAIEACTDARINSTRPASLACLLPC